MWFRAFDTQSPQRDYWIGFILADGCLERRPGTDCLSIGLQRRDYHHLEKFVSFLGSNHTVSDEGKRSRVQIIHPCIVNSLHSFGIEYRKSLTAFVPLNLQRSKDFWRGMIDGDGCLSFQKNSPRIQQHGTEAVVEQFCQFSITTCGVEAFPYPKGKMFYAHAGGRRIRPLVELLYKDASVYLDRKHTIAMEMLS